MNKNLSVYKNYKKLYTITKPRSPHMVEILTNDLPDEWLIDIIRYDKKTNEIIDDFMILQPELSRWLDYYTRNGWILTKI